MSASFGVKMQVVMTPATSVAGYVIGTERTATWPPWSPTSSKSVRPRRSDELSGTSSYEPCRRTLYPNSPCLPGFLPMKNDGHAHGVSGG